MSPEDRQQVEQLAGAMVGRMLGRYQLQALLGAGGMGQVYRATDTRLGRAVAVKILPAHLSDDAEARQRFEREARAVASLSHPNILAIHDFGAEGGVSYAVMELLEGESLRERLRGGLLDSRRAVEIGAALADGLAAAHDRGIIHRDLKPDNIFLTAGGQVKILDFGIARVRPPVAAAGEDGQPASTTFTTPGRIMGTLGYMSPEQVRGEPAEAPSDVFACGCVLYEMLAGRPAFARRTGVETMVAIMRDDPPAAEPGLPPALGALLRRCLEKEPARRYQEARSLAADLRVLLAGEVPAARPAPRRHRGWIAAAIAVIVVLAALSFWWARPRREAIDSLAILPFDKAGGGEAIDYLPDGITESLHTSLAQLPQLKVMARSTVLSFQGKGIDPLGVGRRLGVRAVLTGQVERRGDEVIVRAELVDVADGSRLWGGEYPRRLADSMAVRSEIARQITEGLRLKLTGAQRQRLARRETVSTEAYDLYLKGRHAWNRRSDEDLARACGYFAEAIALDPNYALAYAGLADAYVLRDDREMPARRAMEEARQAAARALELEETLAEAHATLGFAAFQGARDWAQAEREFRRALELDERYPTAHHWYGEFLVTQGHFKEGLAHIRRAVELDLLSYPINLDHGICLFYARRYDEAVKVFRKVLELDPNNLRPHYWIGNAYEQQGKGDLALAEFLAARRRDDDPAIASLRAATDFNNYRRRLLALLLRRRASGETVHPFSLAYLYVPLGERGRALAELERAYDEGLTAVVYLKVDPRYDALRGEPRFNALLEKIGLK